MNTKPSFRITPTRRGCRFSVVYRKSAAGAVAAASSLGWADSGSSYLDHRPSEALIEVRLNSFEDEWSEVATVDATGVRPRALEQIRSVAIRRDRIRRAEADIDAFRGILEQLARPATAVADGAE